MNSIKDRAFVYHMARLMGYEAAADYFTCIHDIELDFGRHILIIGDSENGSYEFVITGERVEYTNCSFGSPSYALRAALNWYYKGLFDDDGCISADYVQKL
jgi:hypothetical protein